MQLIKIEYTGQTKVYPGLTRAICKSDVTLPPIRNAGMNHFVFREEVKFEFIGDIPVTLKPPSTDIYKDYVGELDVLQPNGKTVGMTYLRIFEHDKLIRESYYL